MITNRELEISTRKITNNAVRTDMRLLVNACAASFADGEIFIFRVQHTEASLANSKHKKTILENYMQTLLENGVAFIIALQRAGDWMILPMRLFSYLGTEGFFLCSAVDLLVH